MSNSDKKVKKDFDVWVTRDHLSHPNYGVGADTIEVCDALTGKITCHKGCCTFYQGCDDVKVITTRTCLRRYNFLPRPGRCWNVWSVKGVLHHQEYPLTLDGTNKVYRKVEHESEKKYYF